MSVKIIDYSELPLLFQNIEYSIPENVKKIREKIRKADGFWLFTPENNHFSPGVLKNLIDWLSRPVSKIEGQVLNVK
ncbi:hypothetical protein GH807_16600 [Acetobacterium tundrae]|uniref:NADPH-dependent FMN reductase-like domain-containing protein n=1 Tax=Acetobacterium tundrae TaxID=132932 RepID=A0ABR6WQ58_9FIRM|nr:hypothetical protein [Acetobacterium tundrae]